MRKFLKSIVPETSALRLSYHRAKAIVAAVWYGFPAKKLTVIGITGTDGKTTTVGMVAHILNDCDIKTGALSTAFFQIGNDVQWNPTQKTSPSPFLVQKFLRDLVKAGCTHAVLECSSHGLLQGRMNHTYPAVVGITNISEEHLDYHGTMEEYIKAKSILFRMLKGIGTKVLHYSDESYVLLNGIPSERTILFNLEEVDIDSRLGAPLNLWVEDITVTNEGSTASLIADEREASGSTRHTLSLNVPGPFNLENALLAIGCIQGLSNPPPIAKVITSLSMFSGVAGRMEKIDPDTTLGTGHGGGRDFSVFIDFTVTPKSYETTLSTLRSMLEPEKRLLVLAGSCGDRMREKRPVIGRLCTTFADITVITNEDPYTEDPEAIIDSILTGVIPDVPIFRDIPAAVTEQRKCCVRISDRLQAIQFILAEARAGDIVLLAGKGSDTTMMVKSGQVPWNEREIVKGVLRTVSAKTKSPLQSEIEES